MWTGWVQRRSSTELGWELLLHNEAICFLMGCSTTLKGRKDCLFIQQAGTQAFRLASLATEDSKVSDWEIWLWRQTSLICNLAGPIVLKLQHIYHGGSSHRTALLTESWFLPAWYLLHTGHLRFKWDGRCEHAQCAQAPYEYGLSSLVDQVTRASRGGRRGQKKDWAGYSYRRNAKNIEYLYVKRHGKGYLG